MLYFLQMLQMNFFFLMSIFAAAVCVSMDTGEGIARIPAAALGILFGYMAMTVDDEKPFKILNGQTDNYSVTLSIFLTVLSFVGTVYTVNKFYRYFECDERALTVKFDHLKLQQKKKFLHLENYSVRPVRDLKLIKSGEGIGAVFSNWYQMTELLADPIKQEKTNIWVACEKCSLEEARTLMNGKNAYIKRADSDLAYFLPQADPDADRDSAIFYILMRGSLEDERNAVLQDFFTAAGAANLGFILIVIILMILKKLGID